MKLSTWLSEISRKYTPSGTVDREPSRLVTDGGEPQDGEHQAEETGSDAANEADEETETGTESETETGTESETETGTDGSSNIETSNIEITDAGEAEPADPKWEKPDVDDIPEFETRVDKPLVEPGSSSGAEENPTAGMGEDQVDPTASPGVDEDDPTAGMPNTARAPGSTRIKREGSEGFIIALELCARLPEDARLPEEAESLVPVALEAELEKDIQQFAAAEFENHSPLVPKLEFDDVDGEIWMRIRLGAPREAFRELDVEELKSHALQEVEGLL